MSPALMPMSMRWSLLSAFSRKLRSKKASAGLSTGTESSTVSPSDKGACSGNPAASVLWMLAAKLERRILLLAFASDVQYLGRALGIFQQGLSDSLRRSLARQLPWGLQRAKRGLGGVGETQRHCLTRHHVRFLGKITPRRLC